MIRKFFATEWAKLKPMNFTDKRQYIWEYYKVQIIIFVLAILAIGYIINTTIINPPKREYLYISWQGVFVLPSHLDELGEKLNVITKDPDREIVAVRSYLLTGDHQIDQALVTRFFATIHIGGLHSAMATSETVVGLAEEGIIKPVHEVLAQVKILDPDLYDYLSTRVSEITFETDSGTYITDKMAISLYEAPLLIELGIPTDDLYLTVIINSTHYYQIAKALIVVFDEGHEYFRTCIQ